MYDINEAYKHIDSELKRLQPRQVYVLVDKVGVPIDLGKKDGIFSTKTGLKLALLHKVRNNLAGIRYRTMPNLTYDFTDEFEELVHTIIANMFNNGFHIEMRLV